MASTVFLIRHGETDWNRDRRIQGQSDTPLNDTGREQARQLGRRLVEVHFDFAFSSDLRRATETAAIIVERRPVPILTHRDLRERAFGEWEGGFAEEISRRQPEQWAAWLRRARDVSPPGGESQVALERRVTAALDSIVDRGRGRTMLVVSHGGAIQAALHSWFAVDVRGLDNCAGYVFHVDRDGRRLGEPI
jgi:probable phosphoglycerate mutase